ncbi:MAG: YunC family protein [Candidatus Hydrothermarchaeales archaeon]
MIVENIALKNGTAIGLKFELQKAPLILINANKGFVMCGYLNMDVAERLGDIACKVSGVSNFDEVLDAEVIELTENARQMGIHTGMNGKEALERMF